MKRITFTDLFLKHFTVYIFTAKAKGNPSISDSSLSQGDCGDLLCSSWGCSCGVTIYSIHLEARTTVSTEDCNLERISGGRKGREGLNYRLQTSAMPRAPERMI